MRIVGYSDRLSVEPGESITFYVSAEASRYRAELVRLIHGDTNPLGPGFKSEQVSSAITAEYPGRTQPIRLGSYVRVPTAGSVNLSRGFTFHMFIRSTIPDKELQTLISGWGVRLRLRTGRLELALGQAPGLQLEQPVKAHHWYAVEATYDPVAEEAMLQLEPLEPTAVALGGSIRGRLSAGVDTEEPDLLIAAESFEDDDGLVVGNFYNGKIDSPLLYDRPLATSELADLRAGGDPTAIPGCTGAWDFSIGISSRLVHDRSPSGLHGRTVNMPMRGATGHNWDGSETAWRHAPDLYGAIHFHEDDLDDAGWEPDFTWSVPEDLTSGLYAVRLDGDGDEEDYVPFAVRPRRGTAGARILFVQPTFSYLAYANEHVLANPEARDTLRRMGAGALGSAALGYPSQPQDKYIVENGLLSLYDVHTDGSGVCYSTRLRPILNMRPKYVMPALNLGEGSPHQLNADLHLIDWLHEHAYPFDVITDEDLHHEGVDVLRSYAVVLTGTHHEYWSEQMLDGVRDYLLGGGRMMYLAGNGFYWVTQLDPDEQHTIEIRRSGPSTRTWDAAPGEGYLSTTGERGGLWRYRGRAPQRLAGVGFASQGTGPGRPYERLPDSYTAEAAFIFEGVPDGPIGDFPSLVNEYGAAGYEIDRVDDALGTPAHTLLLASATGFSDAYQYVSEDVLISDSSQGGTVHPLVKADMVLLEYPNGGAVFTPGSIAWCGSLSYNGYENPVSRITRNVLDRFVQSKFSTQS